MQWNARGMTKNRHELRNYLHKTSRPPDVLCIQETFLKTNNGNPILEGYTTIRKDKVNNSGKGGLAILVRSGLNYTLKDMTEIEHVESQAIELKTKTGPIQITNIYIPPSAPTNKQALNKLFNQHRTITVGDMNAHNKGWGGSKNNTIGNIIEEIATENNLTVLNTGQATHILSNQSTTNSVIDLAIVTQDLALRCNHYVGNTSLGSDHLVTITKVNEEVALEEELSINPWKINKANWKQFKTHSKQSITDDLIEYDINNTFKNITEAITALGNSSIARKKQTKSNKKRHKPLPFWNEKCAEAIYNRNKARNKMKKSKDLNEYITYKQQNAKAKRVLADEARESWEQYCSGLSNQSKLGGVWNMARRMNGVASRTSLPTLKHNDQTADTNIQKANMLAKTYADTSSTTNYKQEFLAHIDNQTHQTNTATQSSQDTNKEEMEAINGDFNLRELKEAIASAKNNKSPGEDAIPYDLVKKLHKHALKTMLTFYNKIWRERQIPKDWNHAIIIPILKPTKDPSLPGSYRPISLTSAICKIMEKMVANRLQWYTEKNNLLTKDQTGFRKRRSTSDQIVRLQDSILKKLKMKQHVLALFIDFERAYDMLHVPTLIKKLKNIGVQGRMLSWITNFLNNRSFQVKVGSALSDKLRQENGTPQGSIISPILFIIMINDLNTGIDNVDLTLFADDSAIFAAGSNIQQLQDKIQCALDNINTWCDENGFKISITKTTGVLFTNKNKVPKLKIKITNHQITMEKTAKFLGVIFDHRLSWKPHIDNCIVKCKKRLNLMRAVAGYRWGASKKALLSIYRALIRPILDYGDVAYATASNSQLKKVQSIQTEALRLACGASKGTPAIALQNECGELPLHLRREQNALKIGSKILSSENHPAAEVMKDHYANHYAKGKWRGVQSLYSRSKDFFTPLTETFESPRWQSTPPWENKYIQVDITLKKKVSKKTDTAECMRGAALELISRYDSHTRIYTDGSKYEHTVAAAFCVPSLKAQKTIRLTDHASIYAAELSAILEAIKWIKHNETVDQSKFLILTDSLSVATSIKTNNSTSRPNLFTELCQNINKIKYSDVVLAWVPSHVGLAGNEEADTLAKDGLKIEEINGTAYLEGKEINSLIREEIIKRWQTEYDLERKGLFYKNIEPQVSTAIKYIDYPRKREVQISRLRFGHVLSRSWLKTMKKCESDLCPVCQIPETIEHIILECKNQNISNKLKLKCQEEKVPFNIRNVLAITTIAREACNIINLITNGRLL